MVKNIVCISCPLGCPVEVKLADGQVSGVSGNACKRGEAYAKEECTNPLRVVTTTLPVHGSDLKMFSVKTKSPIPKGMIFECLKNLVGVEVHAPVGIGDVVLANVCGTGIDIVATRGAGRLASDK